MRLEQFEIFLEVANTKSMQEASECLCTSIQNVSKSIKQLESELNVPLFNRTKHGVFLTADGQFIFEQAQNIIDATSAIKNKYISSQNVKSNYFDDNRLNMMNCAAIDSEVADIINKVYDCSSPNISMLVLEANAINSKLKSNSSELFLYHTISTIIGERDIGSLAQLSDEFEIYLLHKDIIAVHCSNKSKLKDHSFVNYKMIRQLPFISISNTIDKPSQLFIIMQEAGYPLNIASATNVSATCQKYIAASNNLFGLCTFDLAKHASAGTVVIPIKENIKVAFIFLVKRNCSVRSLTAYFKKLILSKYASTYQRLY